MATVYKYRVWCNADARYETTWSETEPLSCPVNTNHTIDTSKTTILDSINSRVVTIKDEIVPTGGNYQCASVEIVAAPNGNTTKDVSWKIPISVYSICFITDERHEGSIINMYGMPQYPIGAITAPVLAGANTVKVSSTVLLYLQIGYIMQLTDGINTDTLGMVLSVNKNTSTITTEGTATHNFSPLTPTYVKMCIHRIKDFKIGPAAKYTIGKIKAVGSPIPPGMIIRTIYTNVANTQVNIIGTVEYTY